MDSPVLVEKQRFRFCVETGYRLENMPITMTDSYGGREREPKKSVLLAYHDHIYIYIYIYII